MLQHVLLPVNIHFHWNLFIFEFLTIFFNFSIGGHFENFKNKEHNFEWWSIFVSSFKRIRCVNLTFFAPWFPWQRPPFWIFSTPQKLPHTTVDIPTKLYEVWSKKSKKKIKSPLFCFHGNCGKICPTDSDFFLAYLVPLDVDVVPIKFHQFLFGE